MKPIFPALLLGLAACGSSPEGPPPSLDTARTALEAVSADRVRLHAARELNQARDLLDRAEDVWADERYAQAERYAREAEITMRLAEAKTEAGMAMAERDEIAQTIARLEREVGLRSAGTGS